MTCCLGPSQLDATWTPCTSGGPYTVGGYVGMESRTRGESCPVAKVVWTTSCWVPDVYPTLGELVTVNGANWFVDAASFSGCSVVLGLCRPVLECPDCQVSVYRLTRDAETELDCQEALVEALVVAGVDATICVQEQRRQVVDNAELLRTAARVCLDTTVEVHAGDLVYCAPDTWRVERVVSPCSSTCLLTLETIKEPFGLHVPSD